MLTASPHRVTGLVVPSPPAGDYRGSSVVDGGEISSGWMDGSTSAGPTEVSEGSAVSSAGSGVSRPSGFPRIAGLFPGWAAGGS